MDVDGFYEEFGARLRQARHHAGFSQEELGQRVGLNRSSISNVEKGRQRVYLHMLIQFATALSVAPTELLPGTASSSDLLRGVPMEARGFVEDVLNSATTEASSA